MAKDIKKQKVGFKFGKHRLTVLENHGEFKHKGRTYRALTVKTQDGLVYRSIRLYNERGKFIKQFLYEPEIKNKLAKLINK